MIKPLSSKGAGGFVMGRTNSNIHAEILEITDGDPLSSYQEYKDRENFYRKEGFRRRKEVHDVPRLLYKFYGWNFDGGSGDCDRRRWFLESMTSNKLRLSSRVDFNDPYDVYPRFDHDYDLDDVRILFDKDFKEQGVVGAKRKKLTDKAVCDFVGNDSCRISELSNWIRRFNNDVGVFCLTENVREILMWSHYANSHKGFCLVFDPVWDFDFLCYLRQVDYVVDRPVVSIAKKGGFDFDQTCLQKAACWRYEREWRYISKKRAHDFVELKDGVFKAFILGMSAGIEVLDFLIEVNKKRAMAGLLEIPIFSAKMDENKFAIQFKKQMLV
ncbi:DUF2971 domain-containing protein [Vogesella indigofera]|uniref:DUF2971 domain-containing protein n=1 Tax=Vogesella indigofera TaxID=45465 RepID=UPI00234EE39A|nr:DUF2971 domain-containing protein [Vogesella indigofera]MDC7696733.1 DUF2971 domain-containing protein [Vogesella indigofera]